MELEEALILLRGGSAGIAEWNRRRSTGEAIPQLEKVDLRKADLRDAFLEKANLTEAILTNADLRGVNIEQADLTKAHLEGARLDSDKSRIVNLKGTILREANLNRADLDGSFMLGADLHKANLERASLEKTNLTEAILTGADFRGATLNGAILSRAKVAQANFRDADLQDADLREMEGFYTDQLAGASVSGAKLPDEIKSFAALSVIEKACADARTIFWGMLLGCFYTVLTIATTTDARLITNSSSSPLPIIGTQIPIAGFYVVAPLILFGFYLYFHLRNLSIK